MTDWLQPLVLETELALLRPLRVEDACVGLCCQ